MKILKNKWERYKFRVTEEKITLKIRGAELCKTYDKILGCLHFCRGINCFGLTLDTLNDTYIERCYTYDRKLIYNKKQPRTRQEAYNLYENIEE